MPHAHVLLPHSPPHTPRTVLVTGAAGRIGTAFRELAPSHLEVRSLIRPGENLPGAFEADLSDLPRLKQACEGIDTVLHLAGQADARAGWDDLLANNIVGTYHVFAAAKAAGCRRVVYASSIHAISGHPEDAQVGPDDPVAPGDLYGVSKCFGEALARYMASLEGLSAIAVRIGAFQPPEAARNPDRVNLLDAWVSPRDLVQLLVRCIDDESLRFALVSGLSDNRLNRMDLTSARELLGYAPQDSFSRENPGLPDFGARLQHHNARDGR